MRRHLFQHSTNGTVVLDVEISFISAELIPPAAPLDFAARDLQTNSFLVSLTKRRVVRLRLVRVLRQVLILFRPVRRLRVRRIAVLVMSGFLR
jgi:hypothetical protein